MHALKSPKFHIFLAALLSLIWFWGWMNADWCGFGVDSAGNVYIGATYTFKEDAKINVYSAGELTHSIDVPPSRSYYFTVQSDDTILIAANGYAYVLDLTGAELSRKSDSSTTVYNELQWKQEVETKNGEIYHCRNIAGWRSIVAENGEVVWKMPLSEYFPRLLNVFSVSLIFFLITLVNINDLSKKKRRSP